MHFLVEFCIEFGLPQNNNSLVEFYWVIDGDVEKIFLGSLED